MIEYILLNKNCDLPEISHFKPFRAIVVIESIVSSDWQYEVSKWLVNSGCLYMMVWGNECSSWDDSVDFASLEIYNYDEIPDESSVMTTWHDNESLEEVFWFDKYCALNMDQRLQNLLILHISVESKENEFIELHRVT